jgi:uncharacterized protein (DUF924 family)
MAVTPEAVNEFWFGGNLKENYQTKWFPPSGPGTQQQTDEILKEQFSTTLEAAEKGELDSWRNTPQTLIALIVVLDQFSRHIHRHNRAAIEENDTKALALAEELLDKQWETQLSVPQHIFTLMPLRHQATTSRLERLLASVQQRIENQTELIDLLQKFQKTSIRRLQDIEVCVKFSKTNSHCSISTTVLIGFFCKPGNGNLQRRR